MTTTKLKGLFSLASAGAVAVAGSLAIFLAFDLSTPDTIAGIGLSLTLFLFESRSKLREILAPQRKASTPSETDPRP